MSIQTGWLVTDSGDGGSDTFVTPTLEKGVLKVEGKVYRFHYVFPQYTTKETLFTQYLAQYAEGAVQGEGSGCVVMCGERCESDRMEALFGRVPLVERRASFTDGVAIRAVRQITEMLTPDQTIKFSFSCLKENGTSAVDLLKNISRPEAAAQPVVPGEQTYLNCRYLVATTPSEFIWSINRVLQSPSFIRHSNTLSLCVALTVHTQGTNRESTLAFVDTSASHMLRYSFLESIERWRRLAAPEPSVPALLTYPLRTSAKIGILASHPGSIQPGTPQLLQQLSQFNHPASPNSMMTSLRSESRLSPQLSPKYISPPPISPRKLSQGRMSPPNPSLSQSTADWEVAKLKKHLEHSDADIDRMTKVIADLEKQLDSRMGMETQMQMMQRQVTEMEMSTEQRVIEMHARFDNEMEMKDRQLQEAENSLRAQVAEYQLAIDSLEGKMKGVQGKCEDGSAELEMKDNELRARDTEIERLRTRLREAQLKGDEIAGRELALRDTERELEYERERLNQEAESRLRMREAQLVRQHESQLNSEQAARRRAIADLELENESLIRQLEAKDEEMNRETTHLEDTVRSQAAQIEMKIGELNRMKVQIAEARKEEARKVTQEMEASMEETLRAMEADKRDLERQVDETTIQIERDADARQQEYEDEVNNLSLQVAEQAAMLQQLEDDRRKTDQRHQAELEETRAVLNAERAAHDETTIKTLEEQTGRETELRSETSRMRNELAHAQAELLKSSRALEDKEHELQGMTTLSQEVDEVRQRNTELERLLRESQHYGKMQQMRRELDTSLETMEILRTKLVPSWCSDWARLGRLKDLKEHLAVRADELTNKVRTLETSEREQRVREVALVGEHESANIRMKDIARRAAISEAKFGDVENEVSILRASNQSMSQSQSEMKRIIESLASLIIPPVDGDSGLSEGWTPSVDLEVWLSNALRQLRYERDKYRDSDADKQHSLQELQVRFAELQAENNLVNKNVKEMTNQIIGCGLDSGLDSPVHNGHNDSFSLDKTSVEIAPVAPVMVQPPITLPTPVAARPVMLSPYITTAINPAPLPSAVRESVDRHRELSHKAIPMSHHMASIRCASAAALYSPRSPAFRP